MTKKLDDKKEDMPLEKKKENLDFSQENSMNSKDIETQDNKPLKSKSASKVDSTKKPKYDVSSDDKKSPSVGPENNKNKVKVKVPNISENTLENKPKDVKNKNNKQISNKKRSNNNENSNKSLSEENELIEKLVSINRVAKVVKGGRRFSFAALVVVGDGNGLVGHGKGKAKEVPEAIKKATDEAKSRMIRVPLRQSRTLHHDINGRFDSGKVTLRSAPSGTGVIAGGPMRSIFEALGIKDIVAKSVGSSNPHNMIRATFEALKLASSPKLISLRRGLKVNEITKRRKDSNYSTENSDVQN
tara:strand:- start:673 stop:1575 length:903 start_codon:yes stop_codon:yes gene_type:complete